MKICTGCGCEKSLDEFTKDSKTKDGRAWKCKLCARALHKQWLAKNPGFSAKHMRWKRAQRTPEQHAADNEKARLRAERKRRKGGGRTREQRLADDREDRTQRKAEGLPYEKRCISCGCIKNISAFCLNRASIDGHKSQCRACSVEAKKRWFIKNEEWVAIYNAMYREKNEGRINQDNRQRYAKNRLQILEAVRQKNMADPEPARQRSRDYRMRNPDKAIEAWARRRARQAGAKGAHTVQETRELLKAQQGLCANPYCRVELVKGQRQIDHHVPLSRGGSDDISNLRWLCTSCNQDKKAKLPEEWNTILVLRYGYVL